MQMRGLATVRKQIALEMLSTEESYVNSLSTCVEQYHSRLVAQTKGFSFSFLSLFLFFKSFTILILTNVVKIDLGITEEIINILFRNLPEIVPCNKQLLKSLSIIKGFDPETTNIGQHFINFFGEEAQELYVFYIIGYGKALSCYGDLMKQVFCKYKKSFNLLLKTFRMKSLNNFHMKWDPKQMLGIKV